MTTIQQVLFDLETPYAGHPYYVTGHALLTALRRQVRPAIGTALQASHGTFFPAEFARFPPDHSNATSVVKLGVSLPPVKDYADLFLFRDPAQRWLLDSRPRDAHNTHAIQYDADLPIFAPERGFDREPGLRDYRRSVEWRLYAYLHTGRDDEGVLPITEDALDRLVLGSAHNYGFGEVSLVDTQMVKLEDLSYERIVEAAAGGGLALELVSPYVVATTYPGVDNQAVPGWWEPPEQGLRRREEQLIFDCEQYRLTTIDHGQVVGYAGEDPVQTAKNGVLRVGMHSQYGYGEFRLRPASADRVSE